MVKQNIKALLLFSIFSTSLFSQRVEKLLLKNIPQDSVYFLQIKTDSLFGSKQKISLFAICKSAFDNFRIEYGYSKTDLRKTSYFAQTKNAYAAINAGFFDMTKGGGVAYFEINDTVINYTHSSETRWAKPASIINGAIIITKGNDVLIQFANSDQYYEQSKNEKSVLLTGPLLLLNSQKVELPNNDFAKNRHPRTFFCTSDQFVLLITVDGRNTEADGMSLIEAQEFLLNIGCVNAINLDGGGSTTMWIRDKGIVNNPSDKTGERPVANAILVIRKNDCQ